MPSLRLGAPATTATGTTVAGRRIARTPSSRMSIAESPRPLLGTRKLPKSLSRYDEPAKKARAMTMPAAASMDRPLHGNPASRSGALLEDALGADATSGTVGSVEVLVRGGVAIAISRRRPRHHQAS